MIIVGEQRPAMCLQWSLNIDILLALVIPALFAKAVAFIFSAAKILLNFFLYFACFHHKILKLIKNLHELNKDIKYN
jgi:hypothetical protein